MKKFKLSKQAVKKLKLLKKSNIHIAKWVKIIILKLRNDQIQGETLQGFPQFKKLRIWNFRLIYTLKEETLLIAIIEKRETVYKTFKHLLKKSDILKI